MARVIALIHSAHGAHGARQAAGWNRQLEALRVVIVSGCALALVAAGHALPL